MAKTIVDTLLSEESFFTRETKYSLRGVRLGIDAVARNLRDNLRVLVCKCSCRNQMSEPSVGIGVRADLEVTDMVFSLSLGAALSQKERKALFPVNGLDLEKVFQEAVKLILKEGLMDRVWFGTNAWDLKDLTITSFCEANLTPKTSAWIKSHGDAVRLVMTFKLQMECSSTEAMRKAEEEKRKAEANDFLNAKTRPLEVSRPVKILDKDELDKALKEFES